MTDPRLKVIVSTGRTGLKAMQEPVVIALVLVIDVCTFVLSDWI